MHTARVSQICLFIIIVGLTSPFAINGVAEDHSKSLSAFTVEVDPDPVEPFKINSTIMEIDTGYQPFIVVGEETILVTKYRFRGNDQVRQTQLFGKNGNTIRLTDLRINQRVMVTGLKLADETIVGLKLQVLADEK